MKKTTIAMAWVVAGMLALPVAWAQQYGDKEQLAKALKDAKVSLERGLTGSAKEGKPISAKYELENGKLQLSVYTMKSDKFSEVIVDHKTGKIQKAEPITGGNDLMAAKSQGDTMAKAKRSLDRAVSEAVKANKGYRAVSITPSIKDGHPVADVSLAKGAQWKTVSEKLD